MSDGLDEAAQTAAEHAAASAADPDGRAKARPSRPAALEPDTAPGACPNCETELQGPVCHMCGQVADEYHRPVRGLASELLEGLVSLDGRVARTIPNLLIRPGKITRDYLMGKRARYMPPFRLYIIASLVFFLLAPNLGQLGDALSQNEAEISRAMEEAGETAEPVRDRVASEIARSFETADLTPEEAESARVALRQLGLGVRGAPQTDAVSPELAEPDASGDAAPGDEPVSPERGLADEGGITIGPGADPDQIRRFFAPEDFGAAPLESAFSLPLRRYLGERFAEVSEDPGGWAQAAAAWAPRIMFAMVPIYALLLTLTYAWRRRFFYYDHLIVSMHFHSALFLAMSVGLVVGGFGAFLALVVYSNIYLYRLHRVVYGRGRVRSVLRTVTLSTLYFFVLLIGFIAILLLGALVG
jgi:hypothetical protein